jgi:CelD/BcsL family acetyltransferase involved in cellulose biosynthesis
MTSVSTHLFTDFDDPAIGPDIWNTLLLEGNTVVGVLSWQAQRLWWQERSRQGQLRLVLAEKDGRPHAIAPLWQESGMIMNLCPVGRLDFIGSPDATVMDALLTAARDAVDRFVGMRLYFIPDCSQTTRLLQDSARRLQLACVLEDQQPAPIIELREHPDAALASTNKKSLLRSESYFRSNGTLELHHFHRAEEITPQLDTFFAQHIDRWAGTPTPSKFNDPRERDTFRHKTEEHARAGWLRFSRLDWNGRPIAFHRGACFHGHYNYARTSYAVDLARHSPGSVLLQQLIRAAIDEGAHTFDFGMGGEEYKYRFATREDQLQTWGLYPE